MKLLSLLLSMILLNAPAGPGFYDIQFESLDGTHIKIAAYQGKRVVVAVVSANAAGVSLIQYLDSVQKANTGVKVIAITTGDFGGKVGTQELKAINNNQGIVVTKPVRVKKDNASLQHPLFVWLTQVKENKHFDMDVDGEGQVFIISAKGTLYSVLPGYTPRTVISKIINQPINEK